MKAFLTTCIVLMFVAGIYGASDMTRDIQNDRLINYDGVRERHAKSLLFIIKTTGLGTYRFRSYNKEAREGKTMNTKQIKQEEPKEKKVIEYFEEFSRGCEDC